MSHSRSGPTPEPVTLGLNTVNAQYGEITPWAAFREIPDNVLGVSAKMGASADVPVPMIAYIDDITSHKGVASAQHGRMLTVAAMTAFKQGEFKDLFRHIQPKADGEFTHANQVHGQGTSNATIGLGGDDFSGQSLVLRRAARSHKDPVRQCYPVRVSVQRFGTHANAIYSRQNPETERRACIQGDLMVYPDNRKDCKFPYSGSFVAYSEHCEPSTARAYKAEVLNACAHATQASLLDDSKWACDADTPPHAFDLCDELLGDVHDALKRLADMTGKPYSDVLASDSVVYFFWNLRDEVRVENGTVYVDQVPAHERLANSYLPHNSPTRAVLKDISPIPDVMGTSILIGKDQVRFDHHWVCAKVDAGELVPVSYKNGEGPAKRVYRGTGFTVESYVPPAPNFLVVDKEVATVVLHMQGGLAIGDLGGYARGEVIKNGRHYIECHEGTKALDEHMGRQSLTQWLSAEGTSARGEGNRFDKGFRKLVPATGRWSDQETREVREAVNGLISMHAKNTATGSKMTSAQKEQAKKSTQAEYDAWNLDNPSATRHEKDERHYELKCRAGGIHLQTALSQIAYMITGRGVVHLVTIYADDVVVDKSKTSILVETRTAVLVCETLPRLNKEIMLARAAQLSEWRAADIKAAEDEKRLRAQQKEREREDARAEREAAADAHRKLRAQEARKAVVARMKAIGCCPKFIKGGTDVEFNSSPLAGKVGEMVALVVKQDYAQHMLRLGKLVMTRGRGKGKAMIFSGDPTKGVLFTSRRGSGTEIIVNPTQPSTAADVVSTALEPLAAVPATARAHWRTRAPAAAAAAAAAADAPLAEDDDGSVPVPVLDAVEVPESDPKRDDLDHLTKNLSNGRAFTFAVPRCASGAYVAELCSDTYDEALLAFVRAATLSPRMVECFRPTGGLPMTLSRDRVAKVQIIAVIHDNTNRKHPFPYTTSVHTMDDQCTRLVTIYIDVMNVVSQRPPGLTRPLATAWLAHTIADEAANKYAKGLGRKDWHSLASAIVGLMFADSWGAVEERSSLLVQSTVPHASLGKRKRLGLAVEGVD